MGRFMEILTKVKWLWVLVNLFCTAVLLVQLANVLQGYTKPTLTQTREEDLKLGDKDFPVILKICVIPGFNGAALQKAGYLDTWSYFLGQSMFNDSTFGWAGHFNQSEMKSEVRTVKEVLAQVGNHHIENIIGNIYVWTTDKSDIRIPLQRLKALQMNYPHNCRSLDLSNITELKGRPFQELFIEVNNLGNNSLQVQMTGKNLDCRRQIKDHSLYSIGDSIRLEETGVSMGYMVDISQRVFVEEDPDNTCQNYPTSIF